MSSSLSFIYKSGTAGTKISFMMVWTSLQICCPRRGCGAWHSTWYGGQPTTTEPHHTRTNYTENHQTPNHHNSNHHTANHHTADNHTRTHDLQMQRLYILDVLTVYRLEKRVTGRFINYPLLQIPPIVNAWKWRQCRRFVKTAIKVSNNCPQMMILP